MIFLVERHGMTLGICENYSAAMMRLQELMGGAVCWEKAQKFDYHIVAKECFVIRNIEITVKF